MSDPWTTTPPSASGFYEVRMFAKAWGLGGTDLPRSRLVFLDASGRFDAGTFGGSTAERLWEWRGPIDVPSALPEWCC